MDYSLEELDRRFDELKEKGSSEGLSPEERREFDDITFFAMNHPDNRIEDTPTDGWDFLK